eukprot:scaffold3764_cov50-Attheya_sp.AAC.2
MPLAMPSPSTPHPRVPKSRYARLSYFAPMTRPDSMPVMPNSATHSCVPFLPWTKTRLLHLPRHYSYEY